MAMAEHAVPGATDGWWLRLYDDHLADLLLERDAEPKDVVDFLIKRLDLRPGDLVFDQCCGIGSLAVPLAQRGLAVVGCDLMPGYVRRAMEKARAAGVAVDLRVADAFEHVPGRPCAGAFNWWTSFGHARDDATNLRMLRRAWESLAPGARFALDTMNVPGVLRGFRAEVVTERDGTILTRHSRLDLDAGLLHKRWSYRFPGVDAVEHDSTVRLYTPWELRALLRAAGFMRVELLGGIDGQPLTIDSPRCIAMATRSTG